MGQMYDYAIKQATDRNFPELVEAFGDHAWVIIKAQIKQESRFDPQALSDAGAMGLMQMVPGTAKYMGVTDPYDPLQSIDGGTKYLAEQWDKLAEITHATDRLYAALASYNGGRGYINKAMSLGRERTGFSVSYGDWIAEGKPEGLWQTWPVISKFLESPECISRGKTPDYHQMQHYVGKIEHYYSRYICEGR